MDKALLTLEEVFLRIIEKLPHAAETELTHLKDSVHAFFEAENTQEEASPTEETKENPDGSADNPPVA